MQFKFSKGRLAENPVGAVVSYEHAGRTLLGDVVDCYYQEFGCSGMRLIVRHFNGEPWPFDPGAAQVQVIPRPHERQS